MSKMLSVGEKITIEGGDLRLEVISVKPGAQGINIRDDSGDNYYEIILNGQKVTIAGKILDVLIGAKGSKSKSIKPIKKEEENKSQKSTA